MRIQKTILCALMFKALLLPLPLLAAGMEDLRTDPLPIEIKGAKYPVKALSREKEGWVLIEADLDREGQITSAKVIDAHNGHLFNHSAMDIVSQYLNAEQALEAPQTKILKVVYSLESSI